MYKFTFVVKLKPDYPKGCFLAPSKMPSKDAVFWNPTKTGKRNIKARPLCLVGKYSAYYILLHVLQMSVNGSSNAFQNYFIIDLDSKMFVADASKLSENGGFGGNGGKN